jgi:hypothetical protein
MQVLSDGRKWCLNLQSADLGCAFNTESADLGSSFNSFAAPGLEILTSKSKQSGITTLSMWRADSFGSVFSFFNHTYYLVYHSILYGKVVMYIRHGSISYLRGLRSAENKREISDVPRLASFTSGQTCPWTHKSVQRSLCFCYDSDDSIMNLSTSEYCWLQNATRYSMSKSILASCYQYSIIDFKTWFYYRLNSAHL